MKIIINALFLTCSLQMFQIASADTITVAVASNFSETAQLLAMDFHRRTGHVVRISPGSSGKLYAQIVHGAPYDVFLSADEARPEKIEVQGLAVTGSRFNYAQGGLVLWSQRQEYKGSNCLDILKSLDFDHVAIANPVTAPYGAAATDWLNELGLWEQVQPKLVTGENIGQTFHFAASRNAALGLVAASQLVSEGVPAASCQYAVPSTDHRPIRQQAVLLKRAGANAAAKEFMAYLKSEESVRIIKQHGYYLP